MEMKLQIRLQLCLFFILFLVFPSLLRASATAQVSRTSALRAPDSLTCEHQLRPLAVAAENPRLGWMLKLTRPDLRGVRQSSYRILVSSSLKSLAMDKGDMWDSGKVRSNKTVEIVYDGHTPSPGTPYFWKVMVWDQNNHSTPWSRPSEWISGIDRKGWKAHWIADVPDDADPDMRGRNEGTLTPMPLFRDSFIVTKVVTRATLYTSGLGEEEVHLNGAKVERNELSPGITDYKKLFSTMHWM